jgi:hypothetical protein
MRLRQAISTSEIDRDQPRAFPGAADDLQGADDQEQFDDGLHDPGRVGGPADLDGQVADGQSGFRPARNEQVVGSIPTGGSTSDLRAQYMPVIALGSAAGSVVGEL